jgi:hypothetical protein
VKAQRELEDTVDEAVVRKVRSGLRVWTVIVFVGLPTVVAAQIWILIMVLEARR